MHSPHLCDYDRDLGEALGDKYGGDTLSILFRVEKLQLIGAIALWIADCELNPEVDWLSLGDHAEVNGTVNQDYDAFDIVKNEADYADPSEITGFFNALVAQVNQGIYLEQAS